MPVYDNHELIFHHVPKTGGRAFCRWLGDDGNSADVWNGHHRAGLVMGELMKNRIANGRRLTYVRVAINRHPLDRFRSAWHWIIRNDLVGTRFGHLFRDINECILHNDFESLIWHRSALHFRPIQWWYTERPELDSTYAGDSEDELTWAPSHVRPVLVIPHVFLDFDNLADDCNRFRDLVGLDVAGDFVFSTNPYDRSISPQAQRRFEQVFEKDIGLYHYFRDHRSMDNFESIY